MRNYAKYSEYKKAVSVLLSFFIVLHSCNNDAIQYDMNNSRRTQRMNLSIEMEQVNHANGLGNINSDEIGFSTDHNSVIKKNEKQRCCRCNRNVISVVISGLLLIIAIIGLAVSLSDEINKTDNLSASNAKITGLYDQCQANNTILSYQINQLNQELANSLSPTQSNAFLNNLNSVLGSANVTFTMSMDPSK